MPEAPLRRPQSRGRCAFCEKSFAKSGMRRHLESCPVRTAVQAAGKQRSTRAALHVTVEGGPSYWLHLEAAAGTTLADLDAYLRRIWLECCGHMSAFRIGGTDYTSDPDPEWDDDAEGMNRPLARVLPPGAACAYQYDFGSTTSLTIRSWGQVAKHSSTDPIVVLARNDPPDIRCGVCRERPAVRVCAACTYEREGWLCAECAPEHECGEEMLLPVVNSPRTGVCGYTGD